MTKVISRTRRTLLAKLEVSLSVDFKNLWFLEEALTHSSFLLEQQELKGACHYERLEFFGDAVLKFVVSEYLFKNYPDYDEGKLTEIRSVLVNAQTLETVAYKFNLARYLCKAQNVPLRPSMLARSMEAILGAIYLDRGMQISRKFINEHFCCYAEAVDKDEVKSNYKSQLQQLTQARLQGLPLYLVEQVQGPAHEPIFKVAVWVADVKVAEGQGHSKKSAEQKAAQEAFAKLSYQKSDQSL